MICVPAKPIRAGHHPQIAGSGFSGAGTHPSVIRTAGAAMVRPGSDSDMAVYKTQQKRILTGAAAGRPRDS